MRDRAKIETEFRAYKDEWRNNDDDQRKDFEITVDFIWQMNQAFINQLRTNNHMLTTLVKDPLVQKDTKGYIESIIANNNKLLGIETKKEANNG